MQTILLENLNLVLGAVIHFYFMHWAYQMSNLSFSVFLDV